MVIRIKLPAASDESWRAMFVVPYYKSAPSNSIIMRSHSFPKIEKEIYSTKPLLAQGFRWP